MTKIRHKTMLFDSVPSKDATKAANFVFVT